MYTHQKMAGLCLMTTGCVASGQIALIEKYLSVLRCVSIRTLLDGKSGPCTHAKTLHSAYRDTAYAVRPPSMALVYGPEGERRCIAVRLIRAPGKMCMPM